MPKNASKTPQISTPTSRLRPSSKLKSTSTTASRNHHTLMATPAANVRDERPGNENTFAEGPYTGASHTDASADTTAEQSHLDGGPVGAAGAGAGAGLAGAGAADAAASAGTDTNSTEEPTASSNDNTLIRNEEHLNVGTERVETGEARLRKYVVTETETVEVPVSHEEVRVERTPISAEEAEAQAKSGWLDANRSEDASITLHEERPVVNKETIPVE